MSRPVLLIAGGSRGIGAATAKLAAGRGYDVAVNYKSNSNAAAGVVDAVKKSGGKAAAFVGDMAIEVDIERVFDEASRALGPVTHFVHSSGIIGPYSRLDEADAAMMRQVFDLDTLGAMLCLRAACAACPQETAAKAVCRVSMVAATIGGAGECVCMRRPRLRSTPW